MKFEFNGKEIRALAKKNNISITNLAKKLGVTRQTVHNWIAGSEPKASRYLLMCEIFGSENNLYVKKS